MFDDYERRQKKFRSSHAQIQEAYTLSYCTAESGKAAQVRAFLSDRTRDLAQNTALAPRQPIDQVVSGQETELVDIGRKREISRMMVAELRALMSPYDALVKDARAAQLNARDVESYLTPEEQAKADEVLAGLDMDAYLPKGERSTDRDQPKRGRKSAENTPRVRRHG